MDFAEDLTLVLLGLAALLFLSLYTLAQCFSQRATVKAPQRPFLFGALSRRHSLASAIGSSFSITYLGAAIIWGHLYRGWFLLYLAIAFLAIVAVTRFVIRSAFKEFTRRGIPFPNNILLEYLRLRLPTRIYTSALKLYAVIYFLLLVEELAVGRLVLQSLFPSFPAIPAAILATVILVVAVYLQWGGFRGVLLADFEQLKVLLPFLIALSALLFQNLFATSPEVNMLFVQPHATGFAAFPLGLVLFTAWLAGAVDFYARMNYAEGSLNPTSESCQFATVAIGVLCVAFGLAGAFGAMMPPEFGTNPTPTGFVSNGIRIITEQCTRVSSIIFFAGLFWMMFTTISSIAVTLLQVRQYIGLPLKKGTVSRLLLLAGLASCLVWPNSVSAFGVFVGALLIIPLCSLSSAIFDGRWVPTRTPYPTVAGFTAAALFLVLYQEFESSYYNHVRLPLLVLVATAVAILAGTLREFRSKETYK